MRCARNNGSVQQQAYPLELFSTTNHGDLFVRSVEQAVDIRPNPVINKGDCRFQHWFWREGTITICL